LSCYSGVLPANTSLTVHDLDDVRQIDSLIRTHVLLAELAGLWKLVATIKIQTGKKYEMEFFINTVPEEV
jgi:hypothetical protein